MKKTAFLSRLGLGLILLALLVKPAAATALPEGYSGEANSIYSLEYDIVESNGIMDLTFAPDYIPLSTAIEEGGSIILDYTGFHEEWGVFHPFFNVTVKLANGDVNRTVANVSDSALDMVFILGFYPFGAGFLLPTNWSANDHSALTAANTPAGDMFSMNGTLEITSKRGYRTYDYFQNPANGIQATFLKYEEETGVLVEFESSFLDYHMKAVLKGYNWFIPGYTTVFILGITIVSIGVIALKKK